MDFKHAFKRGFAILLVVVVFAVPLKCFSAVINFDEIQALKRQAVDKLNQTAIGTIKIEDKRSTGVVGFVRAEKNGDLLPLIRGTIIPRR